MTTTDADRLANDPTPLTLPDGRKIQLDYGYGALRQIEKEFGSVLALAEALLGQAGPKYYEAVALGVKAGSWKTGMTLEQAEISLDDPKLDIDDVVEKILEALSIRLPKLVREAVNASRAEAAKVDVQAEIDKVTAGNSLTGNKPPTLPPSSVESPLATSGR
jgi:hypothetical protein